MRRIALLGANGQLGSDIVKTAVEYGNIDLLPLTRADIDVEKDDFMKSLSVYKGFDAIINCISHHKTDECEDNPEKTFRINSLFVLHLARFCGKNDITLFQISTDYVFDGGQDRPYREDDRVNPLNVYGASKAVSEFFVRQYAPRHFILRISSLFGVAGATGKGGNFVETMLRMDREGRPIRVIDDQYMSPTYTVDVSQVIMEIVDREIADYGLYHANNSGWCSWYEFAETVFDLCGLTSDLRKTTYGEFASRAIRPRYSVMDNARISRIHKMPHWKNALKEYLRVKGYLPAAVSP